jgi:hypothetical protein
MSAVSEPAAGEAGVPVDRRRADPLRPGMYCGAPTLRPGGSWCARHHKIVWAYRRTSRRPEAG